ncbi:transcriptional activator (FlhC) [Cupriavidus sp. YR651]|uniref:FlhC family transcriptional regulator n=1 Tax=Cupriavidus sp. YR651 TaxID=1855315 RepID=UPI00088C4281|nr:FlhC family transcriptional regulator [Cupriavidus sp. YR651]SDD57583.1 transcriptional activator (FlhC) [Cupriavidus sp. YR651]
MQQQSLTAEFERLQLTRMTCDRIRSANYHLTDHLAESLGAHPQLEAILHIDREKVEMVRKAEATQRDLKGTPFLVVVPTLQDVQDWKCLTEGTTTTLAVDALRAQLPAWNNDDKLRMFYNNRHYIWLIVELLHVSILAAPLLGISKELAVYLRSLPQHVLDLAISKVDFPMFRWRLDSKRFWLDFETRRVTPDVIGHHFLATNLIRADRIEAKQSWSNLRLEPLRKKVYSELMIRQYCRASTVTSLLGINSTKTRQLFQEIHGESSPTGQLPTSTMWYFDQPLHRMQATMMVTLYRMALTFGANVPEAFVAAYDLFDKFFGPSSRISSDRACHICRTMSTDADLDLAPCRSCRTPYLIANTAPKIELSHSFSCPGCTGSLGNHQLGRRRKT